MQSFQPSASESASKMIVVEAPEEKKKPPDVNIILATESD